MSNPNTIQDELKRFESSLPVAQNQLFAVPEGYFEGLATAILEKINAAENSAQAELQELSPLLAGIPKAMPFSVPSSYFQENAEDLSVFEEEAISPVLSAIGRSLPYEVPSEYFDSLPQQMLTKANGAKAKVIPLFNRTWMRVAAAAVLVSALVLGGIQVLSNKEDASSLATGTPQKTETLVAQNKPSIDPEIKKASTTELEQFIESVPLASAPAPKKQSISAEHEAKALLQDVSVNEMERFLSSLPTADDDLNLTVTD